MVADRAERKKVAVLGGGVSGMISAFELTKTPELRDQFDVTVYQMGWRLGGKGASGRDMTRGARIEEHGLHIWFGFYDNAFAAMRSCYAELGRKAGTPLATFDDAFTPCREIVLADQHEGSWTLWPLEVPDNPLPVGTTGPLPTLWDILVAAADWAERSWAGLEGEVFDLLGYHPSPAHWPALITRVESALGRACKEGDQVIHATVLRTISKVVHELADGGVTRELTDLLAELIDEVRNALWDHVVREHMEHGGLRFFFTTFDTLGSTLIGLLKCEAGQSLGALDGLELKDWLRSNGARRETLSEGPFLRGLYDSVFAFEGGDCSRPNLAAGTAVHGMLRMVGTYRGSFAWKMEAGMGDTIFGPLYEVLAKRGVTFKFFHRVTGLQLTADKALIGGIEVARQANVAKEPYEPLVTVNGLPCWPNAPDWTQLEHGDALRDAATKFEYGEDAPDAETINLTLGRDFDAVVLAIPVGALAPLCGELAQESPRFAEMLANSKTVMTQAFQLWTTKTAQELGWSHGQGSILTSYTEPLDTYCDMSHLLGRETWTAADSVEAVAYFCGALADQPGDTQESTDERARKASADTAARLLGPVWPACPDVANVLCTPGTSTPASDAMSVQYWRANFQPTERYTLSLAGTMGARLSAEESTFANLALAGDWVKTSMNVGCVEASVMAGMQAARAISGAAAVISGEDDTWLWGNRP
ncbi:MAG TPA: FAD-dependent oxidoreductase [Acidimicrobiales bacterium]|jgi:uncharacterized protein with NAD-binding domain and iron-sulfur cluster|nr:FAD-dependent oxidoreductase [Acidimicrobiales bacterium]